MSKKIKVIIKHPRRVPYVTFISNTLENLQKTVGGYIETVTISRDLVIICNEEGKLKNLPHNCKIIGVDFVGTVVFTGINDDEFDDLKINFQDFKKLFKFLWRGNK